MAAVGVRGEKAPAVGCCSPNARTLWVAIVLFGAITICQVVGAAVSRSMALLVDAASMFVDVVSYVGNLWAECKPVASSEARQRRTLLVAGVSLTLLWALLVPSFVGAVAVLARRAGDDDVDDDGVDAGVVLAFAVVGIVVDVVSLASFMGLCRTEDAAARPLVANGGLGHQFDVLAEEFAMPLAGRVVHGGRRGCWPCGRCGDRRATCGLNMTSALVHVAADFARSTTTLVAALIILHGNVDSERRVDAVAAIVVTAVIAAAAFQPTATYVRVVTASARGKAWAGGAEPGEAPPASPPEQGLGEVPELRTDRGSAAVGEHRDPQARAGADDGVPVVIV